MSTGLNCEFINRKASPGHEEDRWYYVLEHGSAPKQCWDWREYATAYGPFASEDEADCHLSANHANPGSSSTYERDEAWLASERGVTLRTLLDNARMRR